MLFALLSLFPAYAEAAGPTEGFGNVGKSITAVIGFFNGYLVPFIFGLAFLFFLWGIFLFFFASLANEEGRTEGKKFMFWGIIAFVIMVSVWGIVNVIASSLGFSGSGQIPTVIKIPIPGGGGASAPATGSSNTFTTPTSNSNNSGSNVTPATGSNGPTYHFP